MNELNREEYYAYVPSKTEPTYEDIEKYYDWELERKNKVTRKLGRLHYIYVLDDGFVAVKDWLGTDKTVVNAARVYRDGKQTDQKLIDFMYRNGHSCYDEETEVLTKRGFVMWKDLEEGDELGIWDDENKTLCYEKPVRIIAEKYSGKMYRVVHGGVDLKVTPNHNMWVSIRSKSEVWDKFKLVSAEYLDDRSSVKYCKLAPLRREHNTEVSLYTNHNFGSLVGFFVGDGYASNDNIITFHLKKERKITYICDVLDFIRIKYDIRYDKDGVTCNVVVNDIGLGKWFRDNCYYGRKKILPGYVLEQSTKFQRHVLDGLEQSDGSTKRSTWSYHTNSGILANQIQILALHCGHASHVNVNNRGMYNVMMLSRMRTPTVNQGSVNTSWVDYEGMVYCAETRTGVLVVRRNGKIVLSGNSPFEHCSITFQIRAPIFVARQMVRHRMSHWNEISGRYVEFDEIFYVPEYSAIHKQHKSMLQGRGEAIQSSEENPDGDKENGEIRDIFYRANGAAYAAYKDLLNRGVAKELARTVLPLTLYTEWVWTIDLHNLFHFLHLRTHETAQLETRQYAQAIESLAGKLFPMCFDAYYAYPRPHELPRVEQLDPSDTP